MAVKGISTPAVAAAGVGGLVLWAAMKGLSVTGGLRVLLTGQQPSAANTTTEPINATVYQSPVLPSGSGGIVSNNAIANDAMKYLNSGSVYKWGGGSPSGWDCSGFCNWVIGHDLGMAIPGSPNGTYSGHGPTTFQWALAGTSIPRNQVGPGDLVVWPAQHMGIAMNNSQMINCPGPNGTPAPVVSSIDENLGPVTYRRL